MRKRLLGSVAAFLTVAGVVLAQPPALSPTAVQEAARLVPAPSSSSLPLQPADKPADAEKKDKPEILTAPTRPSESEPVFEMAEPSFVYPGRTYFDAEYIFWWTKGHRLPALLARGGPGDVPTTASLGQPGTQVLFGEDEVNTSARSGGRFTVGRWLNDRQTVGWEAGGFFLADTASEFKGRGGPNEILGRPYANGDLIPFQENALLYNVPNFLTGSAAAFTTNQIWGIESNGRFNVGGNSFYRVDLLAGFRFVEVEDELAVASVSSAAPGGFVPFGLTPTREGSSFAVVDSFRTRNDFYGGQLGLRLEVAQHKWFADVRGKLALGAMNQQVVIAGSTTLTTPTSTAVFPGGLLAQRTNIGNYSRSELGLVPELGFNVGYQLTRNLRAYLGYTLLYFRSDIVRPGQQIDRVVSFNQVPTFATGSPSTLPRPAFNFRDTDFWAQGVNFGVELSY